MLRAPAGRRTARWLAIATVAAATLGLAAFGPRLDPAARWALLGVGLFALALLVRSERQRAREADRAATQLALRDPLTGLPTAAGFEQRAGGELSRARRRGERFTLVYIELEHFTRVDQELGTAAAQDVLRTVALETLAVLRGEDVMGRYAEHDFVLLLPEIAEEESERVVARVVTAVERAVPGAGPLAGVTASVGSACYPDEGQTLTTLLDAAQASLGAARRRRGSLEDRLPASLVPSEAIAACQEEPNQAVEHAGPHLALVVVATLVAGTVAAWFAAGDVAVVRTAATAVAMLVAICACALAAKEAAGSTRIAWSLVALGLALWFVPFAGLPAGVASVAGLLLLADDRWLRERYRLLEVAGVLLGASALAAALLLALLIDAPVSDVLVASRISAAVLGVALVAAALLVAYWTHPRQRLDAALVGAGYLVAVTATVPWALELEDTVLVPGTMWQIGLPLAAAAIAAGALLRAGGAGSEATAGGLESRPEAPVIADALVAVLVAVVFMTGEQIGGLVMAAILVLILLLRDLRTRLLERDRRALKRTVVRGRRELALQWRANLVALGTALEARDGYTGRHSEATVRLASAVARRLGLSAAAVDEVEAVALLHDIGKIGMPDEILLKPDSLDEQEWLMMREHPVIGERILGGAPGLEQIARSVRHEHERWDGAGYPDGLAGAAIPLPSRIVFACDAFEAIVSGRPYRSARSPRDAMAEIQRGAGTQFDPAVVRALLDVVGEQERDGRPARGGTPARQAGALA
ncbi:MAG: bifunctional diguanylate cyclase/phosphohydrolase [Solirubrobacteraceae bacterium]